MENMQGSSYHTTMTATPVGTAHDNDDYIENTLHYTIYTI